MATTTTWTERIEEAQDDVAVYRQEADTAYQRASAAAETATGIRDQYDHAADEDALSDDLLDTYRDRILDALETASDALTDVEKAESMAESRTRYAHRIVANNDLSQEQPYAYRPISYSDMLDELENELGRIRVRTGQVTSCVAAVQDVADYITDAASPDPS